MRRCPRCGAEVASGVRFCNACGAALGRKRWVVPVLVGGGALVTVVVLAGAWAMVMGRVFERARENAGRFECAQNMRQVVITCLSYAEDHRGGLPGSAAEVKARLPAGASMECPTSHEAYEYTALGNMGKIPRLGAAVVLRCPTHKQFAYADGHVGQRPSGPPYGGK
jgi:hypothetical protein